MRSAHWKRAKCRWEQSWCVPSSWWDEDGIATSPTTIHLRMLRLWPCARRDETSVTTVWATVAEVAVLGLPDAKFGEIVAAWIVPRAGAVLSVEDVSTYCRGKITHFKIPQHIAIVQSLPRTVTGKVRKHVLREQAIAELGLGDVARIETA